MIKLRDYQDKAVAKIRAVFKKSILSVLLVIPTGGGKTVIFTYISQAMSLKGKKALILAHRIELLTQISDALSKFGVEHGMVNPAYTPSFNNFGQVASVQTIIKRLNYFIAVNWIPDVIIVDEAHHATAGSWRKIIEHFRGINPGLKVLGVTATPIRTDGQGLGAEHDGIFDEIVIGPTTKELMDEGYLTRAKVMSPPRLFDSSSLRRRKGDYNTKDLDELINKPKITGDVVDHYEQICNGTPKPTIVFCVNVKHTEDVASEFRARGHKFYAIDGTTEADTRKRILNGLADGSVHGVCSCDLISEGTDVPAATIAILLRLTGSLSLFLQQVGRVLRPVYASGFDLSTKEGRLAAIAASDKPRAYILDHVGNVGTIVDGEFVENHGLPEDHREWSLEGEVKSKRKGAKKETEVKIQQCLSCFAVHEPAPICPECGHVYEVKDNIPKKVDGKLQEITPEMAAEISARKRENQIALAMANTLEELKIIAMDRGFKEGWADVQFKLKQQKSKQNKEYEKAKAARLEAKEKQLAEISQVSGFDENLDF